MFLILCEVTTYESGDILCHLPEDLFSESAFETQNISFYFGDAIPEVLLSTKKIKKNLFCLKDSDETTSNFLSSLIHEFLESEKIDNFMEKIQKNFDKFLDEQCHQTCYIVENEEEKDKPNRTKSFFLTVFDKESTEQEKRLMIVIEIKLTFEDEKKNKEIFFYVNIPEKLKQFKIKEKNPYISIKKDKNANKDIKSSSSGEKIIKRKFMELLKELSKKTPNT